MKYLLLFIIAFFGVELYAQNCNCISQQFEEVEVASTKVFNFKNGQQFKLCLVATYNFKKDTTDYYKDFIILNCETQKPINLPDTPKYFSIFFKEDTLTIKEIIDLPVGKKLQFVKTPIAYSKYYFKGNTLLMTKQNITLPKYSSREIQSSLNDYKKTIVKKSINLKLLYSRLLVAALSDNSDAKEYFMNFENSFSTVMTAVEIEDYNTLKSLFNLNL